MAENATLERIRALEREMERTRTRLHDFANIAQELRLQFAVLERDMTNIATDVSEVLKGQHDLSQEITASQRGMSRPEKIALSGTVIALFAALTAAIGLLL